MGRTAIVSARMRLGALWVVLALSLTGWLGSSACTALLGDDYEVVTGTGNAAGWGGQGAGGGGYGGTSTSRPLG